VSTIETKRRKIAVSVPGAIIESAGEDLGRELAGLDYGAFTLVARKGDTSKRREKARGGAALAA
jgi:hypothetical protein